MNKTIGRLLNWAAERSEVLAKSRSARMDGVRREARLAYTIGELESDVRSSQREVAKFAERMAKVTVNRHERKLAYRVCVDIDQLEIAHLFEHGVNGRGVDMVAEWIGRQAAQAIRECNVVRWAGEVTP